MVPNIITLIVSLLPTFIVLLGITLYVYYNSPNLATLSFDNAITSYLFEGKLISTDRENTLKVLPIDKQYDNIETYISSSNLTEAGIKNAIPSSNVKFNNSILLPLRNLSTSRGPQEVNVTISSENTGLYHGTIQITDRNNKSFVPIIINVKPNLNKIIILVVDGVVFSIVVWNMLGYIFLNNRMEKSKSRAKAFINKSYHQLANGLVNAPITDFDEPLASIRKKLANSDIVSAERELEALELAHPNVQNDPNMNNPLNFAAAAKAHQVDYNQEIGVFDDINFSLTKYVKLSKVAEKNIISGFVSVMFGLLVGFILFLQTDYITNLTTIGITEGIILFLMGVGVGNLNEGIGKLWER